LLALETYWELYPEIAIKTNKYYFLLLAINIYDKSLIIGKKNINRKK